MSEEEIREVDQEAEASPAETLEERVSKSPEETAEHIRRLRSENAKWRASVRELQQRLKAFEDAEKQRQQQEAEQRGEWQKLAEQARAELEQVKSEVERLRTYENKVGELLKERLKKIPEALRSRVPKFNDPIATLEWIEANPDLLVAKAPALDQSGIVGQRPRVDVRELQEGIRVRF